MVLWNQASSAIAMSRSSSIHSVLFPKKTTLSSTPLHRLPHTPSTRPLLSLLLPLLPPPINENMRPKLSPDPTIVSSSIKRERYGPGEREGALVSATETSSHYKAPGPTKSTLSLLLLPHRPKLWYPMNYVHGVINGPDRENYRH